MSMPERDGATFDIQTWSEFRDTVDPEVPELVSGLVPEGSIGFTAGGPKAGKTWYMLGLGISVATAKPYLGRFPVKQPREVVYAALEGAKSNIRERIGTLSRGMGIDPDTDELDSLHILYRKRSIDLRDKGVADRLLADIHAKCPNPGLVVIDVLRKAATIRESGDGAGDFGEMLNNLTPLLEAGCAVCIGHHFSKANETTKGRDPGDRMTGIRRALWTHRLGAVHRWHEPGRAYVQTLSS